MNTLSDATRNSRHIGYPGKQNRMDVLARLRKEARWAAALLVSPWLITILLFWPTDYTRAIVIISYLPGLVMAIHMGLYVYSHLPFNHSRFKEDHIFPTLGAANWITLVRAASIVALAGILPFSVSSDSRQFVPDTLAWASGILYLGISMSDLLDGYVARKQKRETELGKRLDIITDAAGLLVASLLAIALGRLPVMYLLVGFAYYLFIFGIWMRRRRGLPVVALQSRPYSRIIAGFQMGLVAMSLMPIFNPAFTFLAAYIFMAPLLIGFVRDWLVVSCQIETDDDQQSFLDVWIESVVLSPLHVTLRLIIVICGVTALASNGFIQPHLPWQIAYGFCCLLAALGFMGRCSGLILVLLLGSNQSPFGMTILSGTLFTAAAALMLSGTGSMSLWTPEETILYRRNKKRSNTACEAI